jgi:hypothetical protein
MAISCTAVANPKRNKETLNSVKEFEKAIAAVANEIANVPNTIIGRLPNFAQSFPAGFNAINTPIATRRSEIPT